MKCTQVGKHFLNFHSLNWRTCQFWKTIIVTNLNRLKFPTLLIYNYLLKLPWISCKCRKLISFNYIYLTRHVKIIQGYLTSTDSCLCVKIISNTEINENTIKHIYWNFLNSYQNQVNILLYKRLIHCYWKVK